jgi:hypothetical protein
MGGLNIHFRINTALSEPRASAIKSASSGLRFVGKMNCRNSMNRP